MPASRFRDLNDPETLRRLVFHLPEGVYISNEQGDILDANPALLALLGVGSLDELRARRSTEFFVDPSQRRREIELLRRNGAVREFELRLRRPDGREITVIDTATVVIDPHTGETLYHGVLLDITARKELETKLIEWSLRDPLTGCYNRRYLEGARRQMERGPASWGCIVVDIDHFKLYNDRHGHEAGDRMLIRLARFLARQTRAEDAVIRMGGDEFLILLRGMNEQAAGQVASRLRAAALHEAPVSFSLGWAARAPGEGLDGTIGRADLQLLAVRVEERSARQPERRRRA